MIWPHLKNDQGKKSFEFLKRFLMNLRNIKRQDHFCPLWFYLQSHLKNKKKKNLLPLCKKSHLIFSLHRRALGDKHKWSNLFWWQRWERKVDAFFQGRSSIQLKTSRYIVPRLKNKHLIFYIEEHQALPKVPLLRLFKEKKKKKWTWNLKNYYNQQSLSIWNPNKSNQMTQENQTQSNYDQKRKFLILNRKLIFELTCFL